MADHSTDTHTISEHMDYAEHQKTWNIFSRLIKWGVIGLAVTVVALYFIIIHR